MSKASGSAVTTRRSSSAIRRRVTEPDEPDRGAIGILAPSLEDDGLDPIALAVGDLAAVSRGRPPW